MAKTNYQKELETALELAKIASEEILPYYYGGFEKHEKSDGTPVTQADILANEIILEGLKKAFPNDGIVSEELDKVDGERIWYVDPIDGTKGFVGHSDQFAIHIGLAEESPVLGLIYKPTTGEYFTGVKGQGAYRVHPDGSKRKLEVAGQRDTFSIVTNTSFLREEPELTERLDPENVYVSGGLGLRAMRVAEGLADAYLKSRTETGGTWDICAPQAILEEAGGYVAYAADDSPVTYHGQRKLKGRLVMASNKDVASYVNEMMRKYAQG